MAAGKSFAAFERESPELAAAARRLLVGADGVAIGFLATASADATPHLAPVCPIFCGEAVYLCAAAHSPKVADLRASRRFVLHAFLGRDDEELQLAGEVTEVTGEAERGAVHEAIPFGSFDRSDPIFRLGLARALRVHWERPGEPGARARRERWRAG